MSTLHLSSQSPVKIAAARIVAHSVTPTYNNIVGHDVPHVDTDGVERPEQPYTLEGTWRAARLRHAQAKREIAAAGTTSRELITFENGIVHGADLATLCTEDALAAAAEEFGVPVGAVHGDVAAVLWESAASLPSYEQLHPRVVLALSPVRLFPAGLEATPEALVAHFGGRGEPRSAQLAAGAAQAVGFMGSRVGFGFMRDRVDLGPDVVGSDVVGLADGITLTVRVLER